MQDFTSGCDALISLQMSALFLSKSKRRSQVNISQLSVYSSENGLLLAENISHAVVDLVSCEDQLTGAQREIKETL